MSVYIDSWVWIEFFSQGEKFSISKDTIRGSLSENIVIDTLTLTEVEYSLTKKIGRDNAREAINLIENIEGIQIIPVNLQIAKYATELRLKYYVSGKREISYADVIHLACSILVQCGIFYTGDPDFKGVEEIKVKVI